MKRMILMLALLIGCGGDDGTGPGGTAAVTGTWTLQSLTRNTKGAAVTATGTWTFNGDGTHASAMTARWPGEQPDAINYTGTWQQQGDSLFVALDGGIPGIPTVWHFAMTLTVAQMTLSGHIVNVPQIVDTYTLAR